MTTTRFDGFTPSETEALHAALATAIRRLIELAEGGDIPAPMADGVLAKIGTLIDLEQELADLLKRQGMPLLDPPENLKQRTLDMVRAAILNGSQN